MERSSTQFFLILHVEPANMIEAENHDLGMVPHFQRLGRRVCAELAHIWWVAEGVPSSFDYLMNF